MSELSTRQFVPSQSCCNWLPKLGNGGQMFEITFDRKQWVDGITTRKVDFEDFEEVFETLQD